MDKYRQNDRERKRKSIKKRTVKLGNKEEPQKESAHKARGRPFACEE